MSTETCPNGHTLSTAVTKSAGEGRKFCAHCGWSDANAAMPHSGIQQVGGGIRKPVTILRRGGH